MLTPKVVVLGAGGWGANHVRIFHELGALGAVVDVDPARRREVEAKYPGIDVFEVPEDAWRGDWPAVVIATPAPTHYELAKQALLAGKDVFVEKPLTLYSHEAEELVRLAEERDRILMVGHLLIYQPAVRWMKQQIDGGLIGELVSLHHERLNLGRVRNTENVLWSLGVHDIAVLLYLVRGAPRRVSAVGHAVLQPGIEDEVYVHLEFDDNVRAHVHCSWLWPNRRRCLTLVGTTGMLVYDELAQTVTWHRKRITDELEALDDGAKVIFTGDRMPLKLECEHFLSSVRTRRPPLSDGLSGLAVVRVLEWVQGQLQSVVVMDPESRAATRLSSVGEVP